MDRAASVDARATAVRSAEAALHQLRDWVALGEPSLALIGPRGVGKASLFGVLHNEIRTAYRVARVRAGRRTSRELCTLALQELEERPVAEAEEQLLQLSLGTLDTHEGLVVLFDNAERLTPESGRRLADLCERSRGCLRIAFTADPDMLEPGLLEAFGPELVRIQLGRPEPDEIPGVRHPGSRPTGATREAPEPTSATPEAPRLRRPPGIGRRKRKARRGFPGFGASRFKFAPSGDVLDRLEPLLGRASWPVARLFEAVTYVLASVGALVQKLFGTATSVVQRLDAGEPESGVEPADAALALIRDWSLLGEPTLALLAEPQLSKTLLLRQFAREIRSRYRVAPVFLPGGRADDLCEMALLALGVEAGHDPEARLLEVARAALEESEGVMLLISDGETLRSRTTRRLAELCRDSRGSLRVAVAADADRIHPYVLRALGPQLFRVVVKPEGATREEAPSEIQVESNGRVLRVDQPTRDKFEPQGSRSQVGGGALPAFEPLAPRTDKRVEDYHYPIIYTGS